MALQFTTSYIEDALALFRYYKRLAELAMDQVSDEKFFATLDPERQFHRHHREAHGGRHALAVDRFLTATAKSPRATATASLSTRPQPVHNCWPRGRTDGAGALPGIEALSDDDLTRSG